MLTSLSAAFDAVINGVFTFYNGEVSLIESNLNEEKWGAAGQEIGIFVKGFFQSEVPDSTYDVYNQNDDDGVV